MKSDFQIGKCYSRNEIHLALGGSKQEYLPHVKSVIVCGCFRRDYNPKAPSEILPGSGPGVVRWAKVFRDQTTSGEPVPVFIKERGHPPSGCPDPKKPWKYHGDWRVREKLEGRADIASRRRDSGNNDISMILMLERV